MLWNTWRPQAMLEYSTCNMYVVLYLKLDVKQFILLLPLVFMQIVSPWNHIFKTFKIVKHACGWMRIDGRTEHWVHSSCSLGYIDISGTTPNLFRCFWDINSAFHKQFDKQLHLKNQVGSVMTHCRVGVDSDGLFHLLLLSASSLMLQLELIPPNTEVQQRQVFSHSEYNPLTNKSTWHVENYGAPL